MCYSTLWTRHIILTLQMQLINCILQWVRIHLAIQPSYHYNQQKKRKEKLSQAFIILPPMTNYSLSFFSAIEISVLVLYVLCNSDRFEDSGYKLWQESLLHVIWKWHIVIRVATAYHERTEIRITGLSFK